MWQWCSCAGAVLRASSGPGLGVAQALAENELGVPLGCTDPEGPSSRRYWEDYGSTQLLPSELYLKSFRDNEGYGSFIGLKIRFMQNANTLLYQMVSLPPPPPNHSLRDEVRKPACWDEQNYLSYEVYNGKFWNCETGVMTSYTSKGTINAFFIGCNDPVDTGWPQGTDPSDTTTWIGIMCNRPNATEMTVLDGQVRGYPVGLLARYSGWPTHTNVSFNNCTEDVVDFDPDPAPPTPDPEDAYPMDETAPGPS